MTRENTNALKTFTLITRFTPSFRFFDHRGKHCTIIRKHTMKPSAQQGFTLLEIVLAIAILGVALTVVMQQFSAGLRIGHTSKTYTIATAYAKQKLEEFQIIEEMEEGEEAGDFDDGYTWKVSVLPYEVFMEEEGTEEDAEMYEHLPLEMYRLESVVSWFEGDQERSVSLVTLKTVKKKEGL